MFQLLPLFLAYIMFALGLQTQLSDFKEICSRPKALFTGLALQLIGVPAIAYLLVRLFSPPSEMGFGIMLLSICAGGITSNMMSFYAGGKIALSIALTAITSMIAIITVPIWVHTLYPLFFEQLPVNFSVASLSLKVLVITTIPVMLGMLARGYWSKFVMKWQNPLQQLANILFALMVLAATLQSWDVMVAQIAQIGILVLLMALLLLIVSQFVSRLLNLSFAEQKTLAIESSLQNGAMGIALASLLSQSDKLSAFAMPSAIYGVLMNAVVLPFVFYHVYQRQKAAATNKSSKL